MKRWLEELLICLTLSIGATCGQLRAQVPQPDSALTARLNAIADTATQEHVLCLIGSPAGLTDAVEMDGRSVSDGSVQDRRRGRVLARLCAIDVPTALAVWHNHVFDQADSIPERACYFSMTDQSTFIRYETARYAIVQVKAGISCWWDRLQVARAWVAHLTPLQPIEGQRTP